MKTTLTILCFIMVTVLSAQSSHTISVDSKSCLWTDTKIDIMAGEQLRIEQVEGGWTCDARSFPATDADGHTDEESTGLAKYSKYKTLKSAPFATLLIKVDGRIMPAGKNYLENKFPYHGRIYLRMNDEGCEDNDGSITFKISISTAPDLQRGLMAWYPFNGNAKDESGMGNNGYLYGSPVFTEIRKNDTTAGMALIFDGIDDYIQVPNSVAFNSASLGIVFRMKTTSFKGNGSEVIFEKPYNKRKPPLVQFQAGINGDLAEGEKPASFRFILGNARFFSDAKSWEANQWYHIALMYDHASGDFRVYINNTQVYHNKLDADLTDYGKDLYIGRSGYKKTFTPMILDDLRFYNRVLTTEERNMLYAE